MRAVQAGGDGLDDLTVTDIADPPAPGPKDVGLEMLVAAINPADLLTLEGRYGVRPAPPFIPGAEGVARVSAAGEAVDWLAPGDIVIPFAGECWAERMTTRAAGVVKLAPDVDLDQAAMLKANPATALAMLEDIVSLEPGDWVAQNAANSAVGLNVIRMAKALGFRTINVVRRPDAADRLREAGADIVLVDDASAPPPPERAEAKLALDAVGGAATGALARMLAPGGTVANYGLLSGEDCAVSAHDLVFRDIRLRGFWLAQWFRTAERGQIAGHYARLVDWLAEGVAGAPVEARYPLERAAEAVAHAARDARGGKILLTTRAYEELTNG